MEESLELQQRSIRVFEAALGGQHPSLIVPLNNLATIYVKADRYEEASRTYERALGICRKTLGLEHRDYAVLLENYAVVLRKLGRTREAKKVEGQRREVERVVNRHNGIGITIGVTALRAESGSGRRP